jgi:hypothetical protein
MTEIEIEEYFDAVEWFNDQYKKGKEIEWIVQQMYSAYPITTLRLLAQGFFMAIALRN